MEKVIQRSLKFLIKPTKEQSEILKQKMLYSNNLRNQLIYFLRQTEFKLNEQLKEKYSFIYSKLTGECDSLNEERDEKIKYIHEKMQKKGVSNEEKKKLRKKCKKIKSEYGEKKKPLWEEWRKQTKKDRQDFYKNNKLHSHIEMGKIIAENPSRNPLSDFFTGKDLDRANVEGIGLTSIAFQIGKKECESFKSVVALRIKGEKASLPKYHVDDIFDISEGQKGNKGYSSLIIASREYSLVNNTLFLNLEGKKKQMNLKIKHNSYFPTESFDAKKLKRLKKMKLDARKLKQKEIFVKGKSILPFVKYQRLEINYDNVRNKWYGTVSMDLAMEIEENNNSNYAIVDLGQNNMFTCVYVNPTGKVIGWDRINTSQEYEEIRKKKESTHARRRLIDNLTKGKSDEKEIKRQRKILRCSLRKKTGRTKSLINAKTNQLMKLFEARKAGTYYIGDLKGMKYNKNTELWLRGYVTQRLTDKSEIRNIKKIMVPESNNRIGSSHLCPNCLANPWLRGEFDKKKDLKERLSSLKTDEKKKSLFRENGTFHCPCCDFVACADIVGALGIGLLNGILSKEETQKFILRSNSAELRPVL